MGEVVLDYPDKIFCLAGNKKATEKKVRATIQAQTQN